ncbi:MAG: ribosomal L7Ae/L30e/S12e/Gadd45 family protein [Bacilli bacterium]|nr:ribosomal L7Ae/L30e/S12e/Gadd45 family protein [Bacilli bacterium]
MNKGLNIIGLAYKAGKLVTGEDRVLRSLKKGKLHLVLVAKDASPKTIDKFSKKGFYYKTPLNLDYTCDELSHSIGKPMVKILAITDKGFFEALKRNLNGGATDES